MVRTRKNAEETAVSTREPRGKRVKVDVGSEKSATHNKSSESAESPTTERQTKRRRSSRGKATANSSQSDIENEMEPIKKSTRSRVHAKDVSRFFDPTSSVHHDANLTQELSNSAIVTKPRERNKKTNKVLLASDENSISIDPASLKRNAAEKAKSKISRTRKIEVQITNLTRLKEKSSPISEDELPLLSRIVEMVPKSDPPENSLISEDNSLDSRFISETFAKGRSKPTSAIGKIQDTPKQTSSQKKSKARAQTSTTTVTPRTSPIVVNLTPHRSSKTPKKSPVNLSSPKTHSEFPLRLSKTPRKLPVTIDSPAASEKSSASSYQTIPNSNRSYNHEISNPIVKLYDLSKTCDQKLSSRQTVMNVNSSLNKQEQIDEATGAEITVKVSKSRSPLNRRSVALAVLAAKKKKSPLRISQRTSLRKSLPKSSQQISVKISPKRRKSKNSSIRATTEVASPVEEAPVGSAPSSMNQKLERTCSEDVALLKSRMLSDKDESLTETPTPREETADSHGVTLNFIASTPNGITPAKTPPRIKVALAAGGSKKRLRSSVKKRSPITISGTPLRPITPCTEKSMKRSSNELNPDLRNSESSKNRSNNLIASTANSITPRNLIRRSLNLTPHFRTLNSNATSSPMPHSNNKLKASEQSELAINDLGNLKTAADESLDLLDVGDYLDETNEILGHVEANKDGTYDVSKEISFANKDNEEKSLDENNEKNAEGTKENATYEVAEPKTPSLSMKTTKRLLLEVEPSSCKESAKKQCRVRFASPPKVASLVNVQLSSTSEDSDASVVPKVKSAKRFNYKRALRDLINENSDSDSDLQFGRFIRKGPPSTPSFFDREPKWVPYMNRKTPELSQKTQDSVNRLSRPRNSIHLEANPGVKSVSAKKAPNFAQIHQRNFEKMESLVDVKKRLVKRHIELNNVLSTSELEPAPVVHGAPKTKPSVKPSEPKTANGTYNRFGYRIRKPEAVKTITKKPPAKTRNESQEQNRCVLKGVRTNRRFELQMKLRKVNDKPV